jgi:tRNA (guanine-N7-)-methyltransferase
MRGQRLITPSFLAECVRALQPGGQFFVQTDHAGYWSGIRDLAAQFFEFNERIGRWNDSPKGRTRREIHSLKKGMPMYRGHGIVPQGMTWEKANELANSLEKSDSL